MKQGIIVSLLLASSAYGGNVLDTFSSPSSWVNSGDSKYSGGEWDWSERGLSVAKKHKFYGISRVLEEPIVPGADGFVVQYEVTFQEGVSCSGSYLKLLESSPSFSPETLVESSPYSIMFGPDNCGSNNKVHVIFRQENPVTHVVEEKHLVSPPASITDSLPHLYTLQVFPDNSFVVKIDGEVKKKGSLLSDTDFSPSFNPPEEIEDPDDKKPEDWVDEAKIPDPSATKPDDWDEDAPRKIADPDATKPDDWQDDEPLEIPDPNAKEPEDWDEEDDGVWEAPMVKNPKCEAKNNCGEWKAPIIDNPAYKGKWSAPLIDNPDYKGAWKPRKIKNPGFFREENPIKTIKPIGAIAIEILANDKGITFSNVMIGNDIEESEEFVKVFLERQEEEKSKSKNKAKAASKEERERALEEGGLPGMIQYYFGEVSDFITDLGEDSPAAFYALVAVAVIVPVLAFLRGGKSESDATAAHKKDDDAAAEEEDDEKEEEDANDEDNEEDEEESEEEEDEDTKKPRRRTPKAN